MAHFVFSPINVNSAQLSGLVSLVIYAFLAPWFSAEPAFYEKLEFSRGENCLLCHCSLYLVHDHLCDMTCVSTSKMKMLYLERISFCGGKEHRFGKQAAWIWSLLFHLLVMWPWENYLTHLCFNFFTYKFMYLYYKLMITMEIDIFKPFLSCITLQNVPFMMKSSVRSSLCQHELFLWVLFSFRSII